MLWRCEFVLQRGESRWCYCCFVALVQFLRHIFKSSSVQSMIFQQICVLSSALNPAPSSSLSLPYPLKVWTGCCGPPWTWSWTCRCPGRGRLGWRRSCGCCGSWRRSWRRRGSRARKSCPPGSKKTNASGCSSGRPRNRWTYRRVSRVEPLSTCYSFCVLVCSQCADETDNPPEGALLSFFTVTV